MITQAEYKSKRRKAWAIFYAAFLCGVAIVVVAFYGIIQATHTPEHWIVSAFFLSPSSAIFVFAVAGVTTFGCMVWGIIKMLTLMASFKKETDIYFNAVEHRDHAYVLSKMTQQSISDSDDDTIYTTYHVSFEFFDGQRKSFTLDISQYNAVFEGEMGLLTYKQNGNRLFYGNFHPQQRR